MENGNTLNNINEARYNGLSGGTDKMTVVYKVPPFSHPSKRPIQSVGGTSSQGNNVTILEGRGQQHLPSPVPTILQQTSPQQQQQNNNILQHSLYTGTSNKVPQAQKMVLQLQRDPKTGNFMMLNNQNVRSSTQNPVIQLDNHGGSGVTGQQQVASHGYHPGRHLHHQLQLKHLPQGNGQGVGQLTHAPTVQQPVPQRPQIIQPRPPQSYPPSQPSPQQSFQSNYENITYTRTYPQTNQQSYQYNYQSIRPVARYVTPQYQHMQLVRPGTQSQTLAPAQVMTSQPRYPYNQNHVLATSRAVTTERLSHFDYGEQDEVSNSRPGFPRTSSYQQVIENEDKSTLRASQAGDVASYNPVFVGPQPTQIIGQLRPAQTFVSQPNIISTQSSPQFRVSAQPSPQFRASTQSSPQFGASVQSNSQFPISSESNPQFRASVQSSPQFRATTRLTPQFGASAQPNPQFRIAGAPQPNIVRSQIGNPGPVQGGGQLPNRAPNVVATPARSSSADYSTVRPVILTAQQAGQTFQSSPVVVQINGGKSIRGSIVSLNNSPQPSKHITPSTSTHVYFTIPQGNSAAKFIKTPNGHLRPVNGVAIQNSLSQSKMYTVRYVNPKTEDGKTKQFTIYSPIAPSNNNVKIVPPPSSKPSEKILLPKSGTLAAAVEQNRKRKLTPTKFGGPAQHQQPSKLTRIEPKPAQNLASSQHNELIQRVNKSLEGDREAVQRPDCNSPFESFPDAFRKLMKYHIFFEPDTKDSYLKRVDKLHEEISSKLEKRKENLFKKYHSRVMEDTVRPIPVYRIRYYCIDAATKTRPRERATTGTERGSKESEGGQSPRRAA
ncbi:hypothetical protein ACHWQZ_G010143 [Mnemiopsis leidyi]